MTFAYWMLLAAALIPEKIPQRAEAETARELEFMSVEPLRVAVLGMGWWSDVLADGMRRSDKFEIRSCFTRSETKRRAFADKYGCVPASSYETILKDPDIEAIINTTPNNAHLETTRLAAQAGKHVFLDKPIANTVHEAREIASVCETAGVVLSLGYQRRRESHFRWIKSEIDAGALASSCRPSATSAATASVRLI